MTILSERTGAIQRITFNRPESLNAFTGEMLTRATEVVESCTDDPGVRVILLTGAGRAFSAGADLSGTGDDEGPDATTLDAAGVLTQALRRVPKPVVAAVNGPAAGVGASFALAADLTIARESAYFLLAFANVGLMPDGGSTALIPAAAGRARAARMAMLAERIPAPQAAEWGLIGEVVPDGEFADRVERVTAQLAAGPTSAYAAMKRAFNATALAGLDTALAIEREEQVRLFGTADYAEGTAAFREKRRPEFLGK